MLKYKQELQVFPTKSFAAGTTVILGTGGAVTLPPGATGFGIYRMYLNATVAGTFQLQDTTNAVLSAAYSLGVNSFFAFETPISLEPLWQSLKGNGIQVVSTGGPILCDIWYLPTVA